MEEKARNIYEDYVSILSPREVSTQQLKQNFNVFFYQFFQIKGTVRVILSDPPCKDGVV